MNNAAQNCPFCQRKIEQNNRFPQYACNSCAELATDEKGETVKFFHARFTGQGIQGYYRRKKELIPFLGNTCYIRGVECRASSDGFGGVVIQPAYLKADNSFAASEGLYQNRMVNF